MSIMRSMYNGVSGMLSNSQALGVVGDNIANVNTIGYKRSRGVFADVIGQTVPGAAPSNKVGGGTRLSDVQQLFNQGALLTTDGQADLAISGEGFFAVNGQISERQGTFFTRAGQFQLDNEGYMVTADGLRLQGYGVTPDGRVDTRIGDLQINGVELSPKPTTEFDISLNLDSSEEVIAGAIDPTDPDSYNFSTSMTVYDSLGNSHRVDLFFQKTADNSWDYEAYCDGGELDGGTAGVPTLISSGGGADSLDFTAGGALNLENGGTLTADFADGAAAGQTIALEFGESVSEGGTGLDSTTQFADLPSSLNGLDQDGYSAGSVVGFSVGGDGLVTGVYDNGQLRTMGQVVMANFTTNEGLTRVGNNCWAESIDSGPPVVGTPASGGRGSISQGALEQSNVDIATEFVSLIAHQRAFQANGRTITTADEMYNNAIQLKR